MIFLLKMKYLKNTVLSNSETAENVKQRKLLRFLKRKSHKSES